MIRRILAAIGLVIFGFLLGHYALQTIEYVSTIDPSCEWALKVTHFADHQVIKTNGENNVKPRT